MFVDEDEDVVVIELYAIQLESKIQVMTMF
jgi:hypothetical protein